jgi:hypothetical protein
MDPSVRHPAGQWADATLVGPAPSTRPYRTAYDVTSILLDQTAADAGKLGYRRLASAISLARSRHAGWVFVTVRSGANPYDGLPSFWSREQAAIAQGCNG